MMGTRRGGVRRPTDAERFEILFRQHAETLYRFFLRRTGDRALAEDLQAAVFFEAWRRRSEVDLVRRPALPWLYGVAVNVMRNHHRSMRRRAAAMQRIPPLPAEADLADEVADRIDASRRARAALALIEALPRGEREVAALCIAHGLSYKAAAAVLDVPIGTVRSRLFRAKGRMHAAAVSGTPSCERTER